jgi:hypothetical protein
MLSSACELALVASATLRLRGFPPSLAPVASLSTMSPSLAPWAYHKPQETVAIVRLRAVHSEDVVAIKDALIDDIRLKKTRSAVDVAAVVWTSDGGFFPWKSGACSKKAAFNWFRDRLAKLVPF